jgi:hypothetical protein
MEVSSADPALVPDIDALLEEFEMLCNSHWLPPPLALHYFVGFH